MFENLLGSRIDRRSFLKGSAMFAAAIGVSMALPAFAQDPQHPAPAPEQNDKDDKKKQPADPFDEGDKKYEKKLIDAEGREYRICPQCGYNMYRQKKLWVCDNCGYSYSE
jgi:ribosomal protein S27AE